MRLRLPRLWRRARVEDWPPRAPAVHPIEEHWALAFLLHVWVVLMFGTLQGGTAKPGEGVWGSLTVSLVGLPGQGEAPTRSAEEGALAPATRTDPGSARAEPQTPALADAPADQPVDEVPPHVEAAVPPKPNAPPPTPVPQESLPAPAPAAPPLIERVPETVPVKAIAPPTEATAVIEPAAPLPPPVVEAETEVAVPTAVLSPTLPALTVPRNGTTIATGPAVMPLPDLARLQQRVPASSTAPAQAASAVAQANPPLPPVVPKPVLVTQQPPSVTSAVAQLAPTPAAPPELSPPTVVMRQFSAEAAPVLPRRNAMAEALTPVRPQARLPELQSLAATDRVGSARRPVVQGQPQATAAMSPSASGSAAGEWSGQVSAAAPVPPASSARLVLELPRGGAMASQGIKGVLQMLPPPPERKSKLGEAMDKAAKTDCREAYQKNGLLAVVPLVADAVRDKGCQW